MLLAFNNPSGPTRQRRQFQVLLSDIAIISTPELDDETAHSVWRDEGSE